MTKKTVENSQWEKKYTSLIQRLNESIANGKYRNLPIIILVTSLVSVILLHLPLALLPLGRDQGVWTTAAMAFEEGRVFYKDFIHFHLPGLGIAFWAAMSFTSDPRVATMLLSMTGSIIIIASAYLILQATVSRAAAAWAVLLFAIQWPTLVSYWDIAQKDFMAMPGIFLGTWLVLRAVPGARLRRSSIYMAGIAVGISIMFKPLFAITGILLALAQVTRYFNKNSRYQGSPDYLQLFFDLVALLFGALTVALLFITYLAQGGALEDAFNGIFRIAPLYAGIKAQSPATMLLGVLVFSILPGLTNPFAWLALLIIGFIAMYKKRYSYKPIWILIPLLTGLICYLIQRKGWSYHAAPLQVSLYLVAGIGGAHAWKVWWALRDKATGKKYFLLNCALSLGLAIMFLLAVTATPYGRGLLPTYFGAMERTAYLDEFYDPPDSPHPNVSESTAKWVNENTAESDTILVWGLECQIYSLSNRLYASNSPMDFILSDISFVGKPSEWLAEKQQEFILRLIQDAPKFILITTNDANSVEPIPSNVAMHNVPGFVELIAERYIQLPDQERFNVYQIK
ncbi:MAG: hypothetical protein JKY67_01575 [Pseudomonadales bacterium]|nr:hypothetical protein [Pseudomonadales bacterium]